MSPGTVYFVTPHKRRPVASWREPNRFGSRPSRRTHGQCAARNRNLNFTLGRSSCPVVSEIPGSRLRRRGVYCAQTVISRHVVNGRARPIQQADVSLSNCVRHDNNQNRWNVNVINGIPGFHNGNIIKTVFITQWRSREDWKVSLSDAFGENTSSTFNGIQSEFIDGQLRLFNTVRYYFIPLAGYCP